MKNLFPDIVKYRGRTINSRRVILSVDTFADNSVRHLINNTVYDAIRNSVSPAVYHVVIHSVLDSTRSLVAGAVGLAVRTHVNNLT